MQALSANPVDPEKIQALEKDYQKEEKIYRAHGGWWDTDKAGPLKTERQEIKNLKTPAKPKIEHVAGSGLVDQCLQKVSSELTKLSPGSSYSSPKNLSKSELGADRF